MTLPEQASVYACDPLNDPRWASFADRHWASSVFHTVSWAESLRRTYSYEPVVLTTSPPGVDLTNGILLCRVTSWVTGRRLVSMPFADHCDPLVDDPSDRIALSDALAVAVRREHMKYVELRPRQAAMWLNSELGTSGTFVMHSLDLQPPLDMLFAGFHHTTQRKIRRAERERLSYDEGTSNTLIGHFYDLLVLTRRRHGLPPQPVQWFQNLVDSFGHRLKIRVAFRGARPVAAILTLRHLDTLVYKYGGSDVRFHNLGPMQALFWKAIQDAKADGARTLDLGRSDCTSHGLITFKNRLGATSSELTYVRSPARVDPVLSSRFSFSRGIVAVLPTPVLIAAGRFLYRHIG